MKWHFGGYLYPVHYRHVTDEPPNAAQAMRNSAAVIAVVLVVLTLLVATVYTVVFVDLMPQMQ